MTLPNNQSQTLAMTPKTKRELLEQITAVIERGDLMLFNHRTSLRSQVIKAVTNCRMPHICIYAGNGAIVGMLKGRVCFHRLSRFLKGEYDLQLVRGKAAILDSMVTYLRHRESKFDLAVIAALTIAKRASAIDVRNLIPYRMRGVTCSGVVSSAMHAAYKIASKHPPLEDTPRDVEKLIRNLGLEVLLNVRLLPSERGLI